MPIPPSKQVRKPYSKVLGLLQNQWFKDPERIPHLIKQYDRYDGQMNCPPRNRFIRDMLFMGCKTGKVLRDCFTWDLCVDIVWEEISPQIGDNPKSVFPPDEEHLLKTLELVQPRIIVAFGQIARSGLHLPKVKGWVESPARVVDLILTVHPAARGKGTIDELKQAAHKLREFIKEANYA